MPVTFIRNEYESIRNLKAICNNCGNERMVKVPGRCKIQVFQTASCDNCQVLFRAQLDQVMNGVVARL